MKRTNIAVNDRVIQAINYLLTSKIVTNKSDFARKMSIGTTNLSEILGNRQTANLDLIQKLITVFNISPDWLLTGKGEMLRDGEPPTAPTNHNECVSSQNNLTPPQTNSNVTSLISILQDTLKEKDHQIDRLLSIIEHNNLTPPNK